MFGFWQTAHVHRYCRESMCFVPTCSKSICSANISADLEASIGLHCLFVWLLFGRHSCECHFLYSPCTLWPCRSLGNVLWEFKSLCLATDKSSVPHTHAFFKETTILFHISWKRIEAKAAWLTLWLILRESYQGWVTQFLWDRTCTVP